MQDTKSVLIIGAGITGATVADRLSRAGQKVHLIEKQATIGGHVAEMIEKQATIGGHVAEMGCKATDVCLRCNVCVANELLRTVASSTNIHIYTRTELIKLKASVKNRRYGATLKRKPSFIDRYKCIGCRQCVDVCPEKCIARPKLAISPAVPVIDYSLCRRSFGKECSACEQACPVGAVNMAQGETEIKIDVDNVVIATGYEPYSPAENASYGYGRAVNVITGIEAERQLSAQAKITRPSDGQPPKRVAFVQCVGSRSEEVHRRPEDTNYCSVVCCSYALRMAQLLKYQNEDAEITIFYMDIQKFGKGFDEFYSDCKDNMSFIRSRPYEVNPGRDGTVCVKYTPQGKNGTVPDVENCPSFFPQVCERDFDMVILAVGIRPAPDATKLAETLLVPVDEQGFFGLKSASPLPALQREGIFAVGACESPKDIESCMAQAEAASAAVIESLFVKREA
jgi:heterodisulfide reductase subunit A